MTFQPKEYASFSSLLWKRIGPHRWWWKGYVVWGVGVSATGVGGRWYGSHAGLSVAYLSQFDAQAAVETYELRNQAPVVDPDDVEALCDHLNERHPKSFAQLLAETQLEAGALSEIIARGYELGMIALSLRGGYLLETKRR